MSFIQDLDAFLAVLGVENGDIAWHLAQIPWQSAEDRDGFIQEITR